MQKRNAPFRLRFGTVFPFFFVKKNNFEKRDILIAAHMYVMQIVRMHIEKFVKSFFHNSNVHFLMVS